MVLSLATQASCPTPDPSARWRKRERSGWRLHDDEAFVDQGLRAKNRELRTALTVLENSLPASFHRKSARSLDGTARLLPGSGGGAGP